MKVTVLGSGLTIPMPNTIYRYPSSHLVEIGSVKLLLDAGIGVLPQLSNLNINITDVSFICVTHYHADHFNLEPILQAFYVLSMNTGIRSSVNIIGPPDIEERVRAGYILRGWSYDDDLMKLVDIAYYRYNNDDPIDIAYGIKLTGFKTKHFSLDAYSLRIEYGQKVIAYSGDSAVSRGLEKAAKNADLFLCEAANDVGTPSNAGHLNPHDAAIVAKNVNSRQLVLVHYSGINKREDMIRDCLASGFDGNVDVAKDLSAYII